MANSRAAARDGDNINCSSTGVALHLLALRTTRCLEVAGASDVETPWLPQMLLWSARYSSHRAPNSSSSSRRSILRPWWAGLLTRCCSERDTSSVVAQRAMKSVAQRRTDHRLFGLLDIDPVTSSPRLDSNNEIVNATFRRIFVLIATLDFPALVDMKAEPQRTSAITP